MRTRGGSADLRRPQVKLTATSGIVHVDAIETATVEVPRTIDLHPVRGTVASLDVHPHRALAEGGHWEGREDPDMPALGVVDEQLCWSRAASTGTRAKE